MTRSIDDSHVAPNRSPLETTYYIVARGVRHPDDIRTNCRDIVKELAVHRNRYNTGTAKVAYTLNGCDGKFPETPEPLVADQMKEEASSESAHKEVMGKTANQTFT
jgi:hypothetical protein